MYAGYMYQSGQVHGLESSSIIKGVLDTWYQDNLQSYTDKISRDAGFCGDREPSTSQTISNGLGGSRTTTTYYGAYIRLVSNKAPTFECQNDSDLYTVSSSNQGNKALDYPIGLISVDEVAYAGGVYNTANNSYYLYSNSRYWTMSPYYFSLYAYYPVFLVEISVSFGNSMTGGTWGVRSVINLASDVRISGSGTTSDPYTVVGT